MQSSGRDKDVMIYHYEPKKKVFLVSMNLENQPGSLGNLANLLGVRGMNILEGFFGGISHGSQPVLSFFVETSNMKVDERWLKDFLEESVYASQVEVRPAVGGLIIDDVNFPLRWNAWDRSMMTSVTEFKAILHAVIDSDPDGGPKTLYNLGFSSGMEAWSNILTPARPKGGEGVGEALNIYSALGWGRPELAEFDEKNAKARIAFRDGFECVPAAEGGRPSNFLRGHLAGAFSSYFGREVMALEPKCISTGSDHCEFLISPSSS